jgi:hypothetical protein
MLHVIIRRREKGKKQQQEKVCKEDVDNISIFSSKPDETDNQYSGRQIKLSCLCSLRFACAA